MNEAKKNSVEPEIVDAVEQVANRYGVAGLEDLITLAQEELPVAREALEKLAPESESRPE